MPWAILFSFSLEEETRDVSLKFNCETLPCPWTLERLCKSNTQSSNLFQNKVHFRIWPIKIAVEEKEKLLLTTHIYLLFLTNYRIFMFWIYWCSRQIINLQFCKERLYNLRYHYMNKNIVQSREVPMAILSLATSFNTKFFSGLGSL